MSQSQNQDAFEEGTPAVVVEEPKIERYVITCGDEGVQINEGRRLSIVGGGYNLPGFSEVVALLKKLFGEEIRLVSSQENDWMKEQLKLENWQQVNAMSQQYLAVLADQEKLLYSGYLPFKDPKKLDFDIKGHMVRPHAVHIANKICFTLGGGEQTYNLGNYQISAEWLHLAPAKLAEEFIKTQIEFYKKVAKSDLIFVFEERGILGEEIAAKNKAILAGFGIA